MSFAGSIQMIFFSMLTCTIGSQGGSNKMPTTLFDFTFKTIEARCSLLLEISVDTQARWFPPFFHHRNRRGGGAGGKNFSLATSKIVGLRYQLTFSLTNQWGAHIYLMFSFSFFELVLCCFVFLSQPYFFLRHRRKLCFQVLKNISQSSGTERVDIVQPRLSA